MTPPLGDETRNDVKVIAEDAVESKSSGQRQIVYALIALLGAGGAGSAGGFFGQKAMAETEVRAIAQEAAHQAIASDVATEKIKHVIEDSRVIGDIETAIGANTKAIEANATAIDAVQDTSDTILKELRAQRRQP